MFTRENAQLSLKTKNWYVAYTYPQVEKKLHKLLMDLGYESFLPLNSVKRQWSDRIKLLEVPLFPNYLFVKTTIDKLHDLLNLDGLSRFLIFENKYATLKDAEISRIRKILDQGDEVAVLTSKFVRGQEVIVKKGPLQGFEGLLVEEHGRDRFIMELKGLKQRLSVNVPTKFLGTKE